MKRSARQYAAALLAAVAAGAEPAAAVRQLRIMLRRAHASRLLPRIFRSVVGQVKSAAGAVPVSVKLARPHRVHDIESMIRHQLGTTHPELVEQPDLGGGAVIRAGDRQVDGSVALMLRRLKNRLAGTAASTHHDRKSRE